MNGMIAILKDIEKHQTKPTAAMLQALFEQAETKEKQPLMIEKKRWEFENVNPDKKFTADFRVSAVKNSKG